MKLLVLSYNALPGTGEALIEAAAEKGVSVEALELRRVMALSNKAASRHSRFVQAAKDLLSTVYKAYDPLDYHFITVFTRYINDSDIDAVVCTDNYSIKVMSLAKQAGLRPMCYAVVSDYEAASIPMLTMLDGYFIAQDEIRYYLIKRGIRSDHLYNFGLPVSKGFRRTLGKWAARNYLVIPQDKRVYLFLAGGMSYEQVRDICVEMLSAEDKSFLLYVLLPRDSEIRDQLSDKFSADDSIRVITLTKKLNIYMEGADVVLTRPLAFESYEAAVAGAPIVHIMTSRDSERRLAEFFSSQDMSLTAGSVRDTINQARRLAAEKAMATRMSKRQSMFASSDATEKILDTIFHTKKDKG